MFSAVLGLLRGDIERQTRWAVGEARQSIRSAALTAGLVATAAAAMMGAVAVGCVAVYTWVSDQHGTLAGLGVVAAMLGSFALLLLAAALLRAEPITLPRPPVQSANPEAIRQALTSDLSGAGDQALSLAKASRLGPAIQAGETALHSGAAVYRAARAQLQGRSSGTVMGSIVIAAVLGLILGRRI